MPRCADKAVTVHHTVAEELRRCQPRNHLKNTPLLRPLEMGLESDDVVDRSRCVVLSQLHHSVWTLPRHGMLKADGLQRTVEECIAPARCHDLDRHAALEENRFFKIMCLCRLRRRQRLPEGVVLRFVHGAVDVGGLTLPIARGAVCHIHINAGEADKRCRCIIEIQPIVAEQATYRIRKLSIRQRSGGDDENAVIRGGQLRDLLVIHMDQWMLRNALRHIGAERLAIHRQCAAGRNSRMICRLHDDGVHAAHLLFEDTDGIHQSRRPQGVAADEFREGIRLVGR